jgi:hypothetical protein
MRRTFQDEVGSEWFVQTSAVLLPIEAPKTRVIFRCSDRLGTYTVAGEVVFVNGQTLDTISVEELRASLQRALLRNKKATQA